MKRTELCLDRETYLAWRNACPARLLSDLSHIGAWLVETSLPESIPPVETSLPESPASAARPGTVAKSEKRQRNDILTHAIRAAIVVLSPSGALPRPHELLDYLLHNSGKGNKFPDLTANGKSLLWTADNGRKKILMWR